MGFFPQAVILEFSVLAWNSYCQDLKKIFRISLIRAVRELWAVHLIRGIPHLCCAACGMTWVVRGRPCDDGL